MNEPDCDPVRIGPDELMLVNEHDEIVEHLEAQNAKLYTQIDSLVTELKRAKAELARYKLHAAMVGKGW